MLRDMCVCRVLTSLVASATGGLASFSATGDAAASSAAGSSFSSTATLSAWLFKMLNIYFVFVVHYLTVEMTELGLFSSSSGSTGSGLTDDTDDFRETPSFLSDGAEELVVLFIEHVESFRILLIDDAERDVSDFGFGSDPVSDTFDLALALLARESARDSWLLLVDKQ